MCRVARCGLQRLDKHPLDIIITDRSRRARTRFIVQAIEATIDETPTPLPDRGPIHSETLGDLDVVTALRTRQHDPTSQRQRLRGARTPRPTRQRLVLLVGKNESRLRTTGCDHARLPSSLTTGPNAPPRTKIPSRSPFVDELTPQVTRRARRAWMVWARSEKSRGWRT